MLAVQQRGGSAPCPIRRNLQYSGKDGIMLADIIRAGVRIGSHTISRSGYGIMSADIIRAGVRIGNHTISRSDYGIMPCDMIRAEGRIGSRLGHEAIMA